MIRFRIKHWAGDALLKKLQNAFYYPSDLFHSVKCYLRNRYITQTHVLKSDLKKGEWHNLDARILHSLFNELVEFVEMDLAHLSKWDRNKKYEFKNGRCIEAAYDYFKWVEKNFDEAKMRLKNSDSDVDYEIVVNDSNESNKIKELYEWWKNIRPNRENPIVCITKKTHGKEYYKLIDQIQQDYAKEDTAKLIELIKIRSSLCT